MKSVLITITMPLKRYLPGQFSDVYIFMVLKDKVRKTLTVSEPNRKRRLQWCKSLKCHTIDNYWKMWYFRTRLKLLFQMKIVCMSGELPMKPTALHVLDNMAETWGWVLCSGGVWLIREWVHWFQSQGIWIWICSEKYINTLDEFLCPVVAKQFGNSPFIFQDDNAPCHASLRTTT